MQIKIEVNEKFESEEVKNSLYQAETEAKIMISQQNNKFENEDTRESELMSMNSSSLL